jgi:hypothetical protein
LTDLTFTLTMGDWSVVRTGRACELWAYDGSRFEHFLDRMRRRNRKEFACLKAYLDKHVDRPRHENQYWFHRISGRPHLYEIKPTKHVRLVGFWLQPSRIFVIVLWVFKSQRRLPSDVFDTADERRKAFLEEYGRESGRMGR